MSRVCHVTPELQEASESLLDELGGQDMIERYVLLRDRIYHVIVPVDAGSFLPPGSKLSRRNRSGRGRGGGGLELRGLPFVVGA